MILSFANSGELDISDKLSDHIKFSTSAIKIWWFATKINAEFLLPFHRMNEQQDREGAETPHHGSGGGEPTPADPQATKLDMLIQLVANLQTKMSESVNTVQS